MESGMTLEVLSAMGATNFVILSTDGENLTWSLKKKKSTLSSVSLDLVTGVELGIPKKLIKYSLAKDQERSFFLIMNTDGNEKMATFFAPTRIERDAFVHGFNSLLVSRRKNLRLAATIKEQQQQEEEDCAVGCGLDIESGEQDGEELTTTC